MNVGGYLSWESGSHPPAQIAITSSTLLLLAWPLAFWPPLRRGFSFSFNMFQSSNSFTLFPYIALHFTFFAVSNTSSCHSLALYLELLPTLLLHIVRITLLNALTLPCALVLVDIPHSLPFLLRTLPITVML